MSKVKYIKKSHKEHVCSKCGAVIAAGDSYYKGMLYRSKPIVRCTECGLKNYEVTTSYYLYNIGRLIEDWRLDYSLGATTAEEITEVLEEVLEELEQNLDYIPEQLQDGEVGQLLQDRIDGLENTIYELKDCMNWERFLVEGYNSLSNEKQKEIDIECEKRKSESYEKWFDEYVKSGNKIALSWQKSVQDELAASIDNVLENFLY